MQTLVCLINFSFILFTLTACSPESSPKNSSKPDGKENPVRIGKMLINFEQDSQDAFVEASCRNDLKDMAVIYATKTVDINLPHSSLNKTALGCSLSNGSVETLAFLSSVKGQTLDPNAHVIKKLGVFAYMKVSAHKFFNWNDSSYSDEKSVWKLKNRYQAWLDLYLSTYENQIDLSRQLLDGKNITEWSGDLRFKIFFIDLIVKKGLLETLVSNNFQEKPLDWLLSYRDGIALFNKLADAKNFLTILKKQSDFNLFSLIRSDSNGKELLKFLQYMLKHKRVLGHIIDTKVDELKHPAGRNIFRTVWGGGLLPNRNITLRLLKELEFSSKYLLNKKVCKYWGDDLEILGKLKQLGGNTKDCQEIYELGEFKTSHVDFKHYASNDFASIEKLIADIQRNRIYLTRLAEDKKSGELVALSMAQWPPVEEFSVTLPKVYFTRNHGHQGNKFIEVQKNGDLLFTSKEQPLVFEVAKGAFRLIADDWTKFRSAGFTQRSQHLEHRFRPNNSLFEGYVLNPAGGRSVLFHGYPSYNSEMVIAIDNEKFPANLSEKELEDIFCMDNKYCLVSFEDFHPGYGHSRSYWELLFYSYDLDSKTWSKISSQRSGSSFEFSAYLAQVPFFQDAKHFIGKFGDHSRSNPNWQWIAFDTDTKQWSLETLDRSPIYGTEFTLDEAYPEVYGDKLQKIYHGERMVGVCRTDGSLAYWDAAIDFNSVDRSFMAFTSNGIEKVQCK